MEKFIQVNNMNIYIEELTLNNFQKHEHLVLHFNKGVNYIYGNSDAGKSCIRRALGFLIFGDPKSDDIRKEGTKQTSVKALFNTGVEVERVKSASINRYIVYKDGEKQVYDSIGASIPEEIKTVMSMALVDVEKETLNLNILEQIALPFLLDKSASFRMKLFNKLTGNDLLDVLVQGMNKDVLQIGRNIKAATEFVEENEEKFNEIVQQIVDKNTIVEQINTKITSIKDVYKTYDQLVQLMTAVSYNQDSIDEVQSEIKSLVLVKDELIKSLKESTEQYVVLDKINTDLKNIDESIEALGRGISQVKFIDEKLIDKIKSLVESYDALIEIHEGLDINKDQFETVKEQISSLKSVDIDTDILKEKITQLTRLQDVQKRLQDALGSTNTAKQDISGVSQQIEALNVKYNELLAKCGICPTCKQDITKCEVKL